MRTMWVESMNSTSPAASREVYQSTGRSCASRGTTSTPAPARARVAADMKGSTTVIRIGRPAAAFAAAASAA